MSEKTSQDFNDTSPTWLRNIGVVEVFGSFKTHFDQVQYIKSELGKQIRNPKDKEDYDKHVKIIDQMLDSENKTYKKQTDAFTDEHIGNHLFRPHFSDTSLAGCSAWNPYYQFNEDDDIVLPITSIDGDGEEGYGSIYQEMIIDNEKLLYITLGVPVFKGFDFYDSYNSALGRIQQSGRNDISTEVASMLGSALGFAFSFAIPIYAGSKAMGLLGLGKKAKIIGATAAGGFMAANTYSKLISSTRAITRYYDFRSAMPLFYLTVNSILAKMVVSLGMVFPVDEPPKEMEFPIHTARESDPSMFEKLLTPTSRPPQGFAAQTKELIESYLKRTDAIVNRDSIARNSIAWDGGEVPFIIAEGYDIFKLLNKRNRRFEAKYKLPHTISNLSAVDIFNKSKSLSFLDKQRKKDAPSEDYSDLNDFQDAENGVFDFLGRLKDGYNSSNEYVAFRIEKSASGGETISNNTSTPEIASTLMSVSNSARQTVFKFMAGESEDRDTVAGNLLNSVKTFLGSALSSATAFNGIPAITMGNGQYDIPDEWTGSEFTKNYSFDIKLRARYGNYISILYDLYYPLALWLAASLPRSVGKNMYTSPFIMQYNVQGMSSSSLAMVSNLSINRGGSEFGWSRNGLPLSMDLKITIKDLSPAMFLSIHASFAETVKEIFSIDFENSTLMDYISTLTGVGIKSRSNILHHDIRHRLAALQQIDTTMFNSTFWQYYLGDKLNILKGFSHLGWFGMDRNMDTGNIGNRSHVNTTGR